MKLTAIKHLVYVSILSALAIVINLFECYFIPPLQFGIRLGLANIISLITVFLLGTKELIYVNGLRVVLGGLLRGIIFGAPFWISGGGVILSTIALYLCHKAKCSVLFTSVISAIMHSFGQLVVVTLLYQEVQIMALLPILVISAILTGLLTGFIAKECIKRMRV